MQNIIQQNKKSFAEGLNFYKLTWIFLISAILGNLLETIWYFIVNGHYVCRQGVLYGPVSPIYGFAALIITVGLYRLRDKNAAVIFAISGIMGAAFEFFCSYLQEKTMGTVSWDYSNTPFNIQGRTNLRFVIIWGTLGLIFIKHMYPYMSSYIEKIPNKPGKVLTCCLAACLVLDMGISVTALKRQTDRRKGIAADSTIERLLDYYYPDERIDKIYTRVRVVDKDKKNVKKEFELIPREGTDSVKLGMSRDEVQKIFGFIPKESNKGGKKYELTEDYGICHVYYNKDKICEGIEFFQPSKVMFEGKQLIGLDYLEAEQLFVKKDNNLIVKDGFLSKLLATKVMIENGKVISILIGNH